MTRKHNRAFDQLRPIIIETGFTSAPYGSVRIAFGDTLLWCSASVDERQPRWIKNDPTKSKQGWVTAEYSMLPGSTSPRSPREGVNRNVSGRTLEIQRLIGRSLRAVVDLRALGPRTITLDCDVLQADGGTRTAAITGAYVALAIALDSLKKQKLIKQNPLRDSVAAVSCGIVQAQPLLDLDYSEDVNADVDMNIIMTGAGSFIEVQGTAEHSPFSDSQLADLISLAKKGITSLTEHQNKAIQDAIS